MDKNLLISDCAHLVLPYHPRIDERREQLKGKQKLGTTKRGIGPAYGDKAARTGLRMIRPDAARQSFRPKLQARVREANQILQDVRSTAAELSKRSRRITSKPGSKLKPFRDQHGRLPASTPSPSEKENPLRGRAGNFPRP